MNDTILTKLYEAIVTLQKDVGDMKVVQAENSLTINATHEQAIKTNGRVNKLEDTIVDIKEVLANQVHINSKIDGRFESHHQWIEERIKDNKDFAEREINLLKTNIGHACETDTEIEVEKIKAKTETWKLVVTSVVSIVTAVLASVGIKLTLSQ